jgi:site-specific recombinase XerD
MNKLHIKFQLRKDRPNTNGYYPIYLYSNVNGKVKYFTLNHFVSLKAWNEKKQEVSVTFQNWNTINDDIARYRDKAVRMRIAADEAGEMISLYQFEKVFRGGAKDLKDIFSFIQDDIEEFNNRYAKATVKTFKSESRKLNKFRKNLKFHEITPLFWKQYDSYLISLKNNENTRWKAYRTIKIFINKAIQNGVLKADPLIGVKVKKPEGNRLNLTIIELNNLETVYTGIMAKKLKNVLRYFLFSCFTAMRYSDVKNLIHSNIFLDTKNSYIRFVQQKTSSPLIIPLGEKALKYLPIEGFPDESVFKVYSNQITNKVLKDIMKLAGINKSISFHCARHTYATIALELSGDRALVGNMCGHKKISSTQIYAKVSENAKINLTRLMDGI